MTRRRDSAELPSPRQSSSSRDRPDHLLSISKASPVVDPQAPTSQGTPTSPRSGGLITDRIFENSPIFDWDKKAVFKGSTKYYGPTSFSAVFNEGAKLSEDLLDLGEPSRGNPANVRHLLFL